MHAKTELKKRAVELRSLGKTYSEIRKEVPVAKSTLSLWFLDVGLSEVQKQRITQKRVDAQKRGAARRREQRLEITKEINELAKQDIADISDRELWLMGVALYWAEGSKQKEWNVSQSLQLTNSDPRMVKLFLKWLTYSLRLPYDDILLSLAIHENNKYRLEKVKEFWKEQTGNHWDFSDRVYFKRHTPKPGRHNLGETYYGVLRITVRNSTNLNRKVAAWVETICGHCGVV
ncbi:MAG: hypothetical protein V4674_01165 [Patescibacteria group bacterium]